MNDDSSLAAFQNPSAAPDESFGDMKHSASAYAHERTEPSFLRDSHAIENAEQAPRDASFGIAAQHPPNGEAAARAEAADRNERERLVNRLHRLSIEGKLGSLVFTDDAPLSTLKALNRTATHMNRAKTMIVMIQRALVFMAYGAENLSKRFPSRWVQLDGYGSYLKSQIDSYQSLIYDVYEHYSEQFAAATPLLTLVCALGTNAAMYSVHRAMTLASLGASDTSKASPKEEESESPIETPEAVPRHAPTENDNYSDIQDANSLRTFNLLNQTSDVPVDTSRGYFGAAVQPNPADPIDATEPDVQPPTQPVPPVAEEEEAPTSPVVVELNLDSGSSSATEIES